MLTCNHYNDLRIVCRSGRGDVLLFVVAEYCVTIAECGSRDV